MTKYDPLDWATNRFADGFFEKFKSHRVATKVRDSVVTVTMSDGRKLLIVVDDDLDESHYMYSVELSSFDLPAGSAWRTHDCAEAINFAARDLGLLAPERAVV